MPNVHMVAKDPMHSMLQCHVRSGKIRSTTDTGKFVCGNTFSPNDLEDVVEGPGDDMTWCMKRKQAPGIAHEREMRTTGFALLQSV